MKSTGFVLTAILCILFLTSPGYGAQEIQPSAGFTLSNEHVRLEFEPEGMGLSAMVDLKTGYNHIGEVEEKHTLWEVAFSEGGVLTRRFTNNNFPCTYAKLENLPNGNQRVTMDWQFKWFGKDRHPVSIRVRVELPKDCGVAQWRIFVENQSWIWGIWEVNFPKVSGFPAPGTYDIARPIFAGGGQLLRAHSSRVRGRYPSGGWPMQLMSLNKGTNGVYFASMDPDARAKDFVADPSEKQLTMTHYPDDMGIEGSDYPDYYPVAFGVYQGGWLEAAHIYRPWALKQKWTQKGPISQRTDIPDIVKNIGLWTQSSWVWDEAEGTPHEMNLPFLNARDKMDVPMGIHWYNWHQNRFDNLYPHFLPPKPEFRDRVKELVDTGLLIMPYINGSSTDINIPDWKEFEPHAILDEGGGFRHHFYGSNPMVSMCPSQVFWQDEISMVIDSLVGYYGVNGVYIDQISAMSHELCFNKNHRHPMGGGSYWADGNRELLRKVENVAHRNGRDFVITSEGADEVFFDVLSANLMWDYPTDKHIPLMYVVYSGYTLFFGSRCSFTGSNRFFNFFQGQCFIDGRQNGWMNFRMFRPEHSEKADYFRQAGHYRLAAKKFVTYGRLWGPVEPLNSVPTFTEDKFGWRANEVSTVPCAEARLWQAEDGNLAVLFANYVNEDLPFTYSIDPAMYGLKAGRYRLTEISPEGPSPLGTVYGTIERTENLGPRKLKVIEISPIK